MNVYKKLQIARLSLQEKSLKQTGYNKHLNYKYFQLEDFLPTVQTIFGDTGLTAVFRCDSDMASLTVYDTDTPESSITFTAPMAMSEQKGNNLIQNVGASITYLRRYLYVNALEIVENDVVDAVYGKEEPKPVAKPAAKPAEAPKPVAKPPEPATPAKTVDGAELGVLKVPVAPEGDPTEWLELVKEASLVALGFAENQDGVMQIFKKNKVLFDAVKATDEAFFKELMGEFAKVKKQFEGITNG